jgi:hypothetical protein
VIGLVLDLLELDDLEFRVVIVVDDLGEQLAPLFHLLGQLFKEIIKLLAAG